MKDGLVQSGMDNWVNPKSAMRQIQMSALIRIYTGRV